MKSRLEVRPEQEERKRRRISEPPGPDERRIPKSDDRREPDDGPRGKPEFPEARDRVILEGVTEAKERDGGEDEGDLDVVPRRHPGVHPFGRDDDKEDQ